MDSALLLICCYVIQAFLSGSTLTILKNELCVFFGQLSRFNVTRAYMWLVPVSNAITSLSGDPQHLSCDSVQGCKDNMENLQEAFRKKDVSLCEMIITIQIAEHVVFRRIDEAAEIVRQYQEFFDLQSYVSVKFVYRTFYSGLVAFHCFRETQDQYWMDRGKKSLCELETWTAACNWNFHNKMLLLSAEYHFAIGDFEKATQEYQLAITSARNHRFINEEALANELAGYFQLRRGSKDLSRLLINQAIKCYQRWGATKKASILQHN